MGFDFSVSLTPEMTVQGIVSLSLQFYEDLCIPTHIRVENRCAHILSRVHAFTTRAHAFGNGSS